MSLGKQAKILTPKQQQIVLDHVSHLRHAQRDRVIVLLSYRAGLRVKEISSLNWSMVTDAEGAVAQSIAIPNKASKGKRGGRTIPLNAELRAALAELHQARIPFNEPDDPIVFSERGHRLSPNSLAIWFGRQYQALGFDGASSHSGRRTFCTTAAKKISQVDGSLRDVQQLMGHASLAQTQTYIEGNSEAKKKVVDLL